MIRQTVVNCFPSLNYIRLKTTKDKFKCTYSGKIDAKNKGSIDMYFVEGELSAAQA